MTHDDIVGSLRAAVIRLMESLPEADIRRVWSLIDAGEPGVALENLCTQLDEYEVAIDDRTRQILVGVAEKMGMDRHMVDVLASTAEA